MSPYKGAGIATSPPSTPPPSPPIWMPGGLGGVVYINGSFSPTFENLILRNGSASALGGGPGQGCGRRRLYQWRALAIFKNTDIANNQSPDLGAEVYLASGNVVNFQGGFIRNNVANERRRALCQPIHPPSSRGSALLATQRRWWRLPLSQPRPIH